jgi:hypothetical protein
VKPVAKVFLPVFSQVRLDTNESSRSGSTQKRKVQKPHRVSVQKLATCRFLISLGHVFVPWSSLPQQKRDFLARFRLPISWLDRSAGGAGVFLSVVVITDDTPSEVSFLIHFVHIPRLVAFVGTFAGPECMHVSQYSGPAACNDQVQWTCSLSTVLLKKTSEASDVRF